MISIIIPIYNGEKYIENCIKSIQNRVSPFHEIEIILIDDGSTDKSGAICDYLAEKIEYIKVIHQENSGVSVARQRGIKEAKFKNIMFVDVDDIIGSDFNFKIDDKIDLYIFSKYFERDFIIDSKNNYYNLIEGLLGVNKNNLYTKSHINAVWSKIYKANILKDNNIKFDKDISHGEDILFNLKYITNCNKIKCVNKSFYILQQNNMSATHKFQENSIINDYNYYKELRKFNFDNDEHLNKIYYNSVLNGIWITLNQYFFNKKNNKKLYILKKELKKMILKEPYNTAINKYIYLSEKKQKLFFILMKYKQITLLSILYKLGVKISKKRKLDNYKI